MSDQNIEANSATNHKIKQPTAKGTTQDKVKDTELASKMKRKRKSTVPKLHAQSKQDNQVSNQKQVKLTELWKGTHGAASQSLSKNTAGSEMLKKRIQEEIEVKNKKIADLRKQRDEYQRKYNLLQNQKRIYQSRVKQSMKKVLLDLAKRKRSQRCQINPQYGYYKDTSTFIQGPFTKQLRATIQQKKKQILQLQQQELNMTKKDKQMLQFKMKFLQKQLDQMNQEMKDREKLVLQYKEKLRFADKETNCYYFKLGWPAIGDEERFQVLELLGSGGFGEVYKCYDLLTNCYVALKENRFTTTGPKVQQHRQQFLKHVNRQVKIQKSLHHPNIAKFIQVIKIDQTQVSFILQYCQGPQLSKYFKKYQCLQQKQAKQIIRQIFCALKYLYQQDNKIIHYDLKPSNIMFHRGTIKILDFGLCKQMDTDQTRMNLTSQGVGTYWYLPPQTFFDCGAEVSSKVDVWSAGVIFYELLYGRRPFGHGLSQAKIMHQQIILKQALKLEFPAQTPLKYKVSQSAKNFIQECLKYKQQDRLSPLQAYDHPYFN